MKKTFIIISTLILILGSIQLIYASDKHFSDVNGEWFSAYVSPLADGGVIDGYNDGTFKPNNYINVDEFIKLAVSATVYEKIDKGDDYWASAYLLKARDIGVVQNGDFDKFTRPIVRGEMARIAARFLKSTEKYPQSQISSLKDYYSIPISFRNSVFKTQYKGIIKGYPDGNFLWDRKATRAEASVIIKNIIDYLKN